MRSKTAPVVVMDPLCNSLICRVTGIKGVIKKPAVMNQSLDQRAFEFVHCVSIAG